MSDRRLRLSEDDLPYALVFVAAAAFACLMPAQADTFYHLASGRWMWEHGSLLTREVFSHTSAGFPHPNHWWLGQLAFYGTFVAGGPVALTLASGGCALAAIVASWRYTRECRFEARLLLLLALGVTLPAWSVRPQVLSMGFLMIAVHLVIQRRLWWIPPVLAVWANVHGLVIFGVAMAWIVAIDAFGWQRERVRRAVAVAVVSTLAPLATPLGHDYWPWLLTTVADARALDILEFRNAWAAGWDAAGLLTLGAVFLVLAVRARSTFAALNPATRILVLTSGALLGASLLSIRNAAFFALVAVPAIARLLPAGRGAARHVRPAGRVAYATLGLATVIAATIVGSRWRDGGQRVGWQPLSPAAIEAVRTCPPPLYNSLGDGGFLIWFVPEQRVFIDGRTDAYPIGFLRRVGPLERAGDYEALFEDYGVRCAFVGRNSAVGVALMQARMPPRFADDRWMVVEAR
jgi:hypothetical protein